MGEKFRDSALVYKVYEKVVKGYKHPNALLKKEKILIAFCQEYFKLQNHGFLFAFFFFLMLPTTFSSDPKAPLL